MAKTVQNENVFWQKLTHAWTDTYTHHTCIYGTDIKIHTCGQKHCHNLIMAFMRTDYSFIRWLRVKMIITFNVHKFTAKPMNASNVNNFPFAKHQVELTRFYWLNCVEITLWSHHLNHSPRQMCMEIWWAEKMQTNKQTNKQTLAFAHYTIIA